MRAKAFQILWHDKQPVFSVDFDPNSSERKFATCGGDQHVRIWRLYAKDVAQPPQVEFLSTLSRHTATVNCVRWSPNGQLIASGGDDGMILLWEKNTSGNVSMLEDDEENKEHWRVSSILRGTTSDLYDLAWDPNGQFIISACIDNTARVFDLKTQKCIKVLTDHTHFVQGVAWDPLNKFAVTQSADRAMHLYSIDTNAKSSQLEVKLVTRHTKVGVKVKTSLPKDASSSTTTMSQSYRMFHDETLVSFFRRPTFSPDGSLLVAPAGLVRENDISAGKDESPSKKAPTPVFSNGVYVFGRGSLSGTPLIHLSGFKKPAIAIRFNPQFYALKTTTTTPPMIQLDYRMIFAVATQDSVLIYDTQHRHPIAFFSNLHYSTFTDVAWSPDGNSLILASSDGYCSVAEFEDGELGEVKDVEGVKENTNASKDTEIKLGSIPQMIPAESLKAASNNPVINTTAATFAATTSTVISTPMASQHVNEPPVKKRITPVFLSSSASFSK